MEKVSGNKYLLKGNLQMNGVSKPLELDVKFGGIMKDPWGNTKAGFKITGVINRYDYNLKYNSTLEAGGLLIGQDVNLEMFIELSKK
jgi:polyisoprenoid-binding protein YceI